jgi:hypothetical protein
VRGAEPASSGNQQLVPAPRGITPSAGGRPQSRLGALVASTPGRFTTLLIGIIVVGLAFGAVSLSGVLQRSGAMGDVRTSSGPLTVTAQSIYRSLYDADATAAAAFLHAGSEPADLRQRYDSDIAAASAGLAQAAASGGVGSAAITVLSVNLPIYTGLIETARADNRLGYPIGGAYLREASALMHSTILPAAASLYHAETVTLSDDSGDAGSFPWLAVTLGVIMLALLVLTGRVLSRRTKRTLNLGVLGAFGAIVITLIWLLASWGATAANLHEAKKDGSAQVEMLAQIRIAVLEARADESLTLVARGSGSSFETDYNQMMTRLIGKSGSGGLLAAAAAQADDPGVRRSINATATDLRGWLSVHKTLRKADDTGDYPDAVKLAIGNDAGQVPAYFNRIDGNISSAIDTLSKTFSDRSRSATSAMGGLPYAVSILTVLAIAAAAAGIQRRIAEYR